MVVSGEGSFPRRVAVASGPARSYCMKTRVDRIGVVIPVHDEQSLLPACLDAIAMSVSGVGVPVTVIVVLDACTDDSAAVVAGFPGVEAVVVDAHSVGVARVAGITEMLRRHGESGTWLATTDGDSVVPANWLSAQVRHARAGARVVAGTVRVADWGDRSPAVRDRARREYRAVPHRHVHGANLSFSAAAYRTAGGFPSVSHDEDVELVHAFRANGEPIRWATDLPVLTSARRDPRAPNGFGHYLSVLEASVDEDASGGPVAVRRGDPQP